MTRRTAFPTILLETPPIPIGLTPGCLSRAISRPVIKAEMPTGSIYLVHSFLATAARDEHRSSDDFLKHEQNLLQSAASAQEGPADP